MYIHFTSSGIGLKAGEPIMEVCLLFWLPSGSAVPFPWTCWGALSLRLQQLLRHYIAQHKSTSSHSHPSVSRCHELAWREFEDVITCVEGPSNVSDTVLLHLSEALTLSCALVTQTDAFCKRLCWFLVHNWQDHVSYQQLHHETGIEPVTCT